jgi:primosomal protein N' (replication factor Y) (superfamily II helicase)
VVIQTYQPEHYSVQYAAKQDYEGFYEEEMSYRKMLRYPPAASMAALLICRE